LAVVLNFTLFAFNLNADPGTSGAEYLRLGAGARAAAMGEAFTPLADGAASLFWNPAGLGFTKWKEVQASQLVGIERVATQHVAYAHPFGEKTAAGLGVVRLDSGDLEGRDEFDLPTENFNVTGLAAVLGAGRRLTPRLSAGLAVKWASQKVADQSGSAVAADLGAQYEWPLPGHSVRWGAAARNLGGKIGPGEKADLPTEYRVGVADRLAKETLVLSAEGVFPTDTDPRLNAGAEVFVAGFFSLRAGYRFLRDDATGVGGLTAGFGLIYPKVQDYVVDYAYSGQGDLGSAHRLSLSVRF
jgi:hypothetical protein